MTYLLQVLLLLLTCLLQASPFVASTNLAIPTHAPTFSAQATQKLESEEKEEVFHFARSGIEENIAKQTPSHFTTTKQSPSFLNNELDIDIDINGDGVINNYSIEAYKIYVRENNSMLNSVIIDF